MKYLIFFFVAFFLIASLGKTPERREYVVQNQKGKVFRVKVDETKLTPGQQIEVRIGGKFAKLTVIR